AAALWWLAPWRAWLTPSVSAPPPSRDTVRVSQAPPPAVPTDTTSGRGAPVPAPTHVARPPSRARVPARSPAAGAESAAHPPVAPAATPAPVDPRPDIQKVIDDYARALESRDVGQVRRAYPGLTSPQQQSWQDFFQSVRNLKAGLTVTAVRLSGLTAETIVSGVYEYDNATTGRAERRPVTFRATLAVDSGGWRLTAIR